MILRRAILLPILVVITTLVASCTNQPLPYTLASESMMPEFVHNAPDRVQEAYRFAVANPHELEKYPCFCGCGKMGHTSNRSCYIKDIDVAGEVTFDDHAAGCGICVDITQDVMRLMREGRSSREIRTYIDGQYSSFGPSTDTPLPEA